MEESLQRMQKEFKKNRTAAFVLIGILVLGMIFAILRNMPLSLFFVVLALAYQMVVLRIMGKRYEKKMNTENISQTICRELSDAVLDENGGAGLTPEMVEEAELLPHFEEGKSPFSAFKGVCGVMPTWRGVSGPEGRVKVIVSDVALNDTYTDVKGARKGLMNVGCFVHAEFPQKTGYNLRAMAEGPLLTHMEEDFQAKFPELVRVSSAKLQIPDTLHVYAPEGADFPSAEFFKKLKNLADFTSGEMWMSLKEDHADFYFRNRFLAVPVNVKIAPTREMIGLDPLPELKRVLEILKEVD